MNKAETLQEIKRAEAEVRGVKEAADQERDRVVREARREALGLGEQLRRESEERAVAIMRNAETEIEKEREATLAKGRKEAEALRAAGMANVDRAVELVVTKFQGALDA